MAAVPVFSLPACTGRATRQRHSTTSCSSGRRYPFLTPVKIFGDLRIRDLLGAPRELVSVLSKTMPQKMNARLAANFDDAMTGSLATGEVYVTLNGDWIASGQFVSAGDARALEEGAGLLAFKRELRELEVRSEVLRIGVDARPHQAAKLARTRLVGLEDAVVYLNEAMVVKSAR